MTGRAYHLLQTFRASLSGAQRSFIMARFILLARIDPESITPELDDSGLEVRIEQAIAKLQPTLKLKSE